MEKKFFFKIWYFLNFMSKPDPDSSLDPVPDLHQADADPRHCMPKADQPILEPIILSNLLKSQTKVETILA